MADVNPKVKAARELSAALEVAERDDRGKFYRLKDGSPWWMRDAIRAAHGDEMPDDFIYETCSNVADAIAELDDDTDEDAIRERLDEIEPDCYTSDLLKWLSGNLGRMDYCTQAMRNGADDFSAVLTQGQGEHIREIAAALYDALPEDTETA
jgi:hypothetical protein